MTIADRLRMIEERMASAAARAGRAPGSVDLVLVTKLRPSAALREAFAAGAHRFGENYVQELRGKQVELADLPIEWHLVGRLQKNKVKDVVGRVALIHSVGDRELAEALGRRAAAAGRIQEILVQVNVAGETTKAGVAPDQLPALLDVVSGQPALSCIGLMTMPPPTERADDNRPFFRALAQMAARHELPCLSMGMTDDFEVAIEEGATLVRIGRAIFHGVP